MKPGAACGEGKHRHNDDTWKTDPAGSEGDLPPLTYEPGIHHGTLKTTPRALAEANPRSVMIGGKKVIAGVEPLRGLEQSTRRLDVETMLRSRGARSAVTEVYSPPRIAQTASAF